MKNYGIKGLGVIVLILSVGNPMIKADEMNTYIKIWKDPAQIISSLFPESKNQDYLVMQFGFSGSGEKSFFALALSNKIAKVNINGVVSDVILKKGTMKTILDFVRSYDPQQGLFNSERQIRDSGLFLITGIFNNTKIEFGNTLDKLPTNDLYTKSNKILARYLFDNYLDH